VLASLGNNELKLKLKSVIEMKKTTKKSTASSTTAAPSAAGKPAAPAAVSAKPAALSAARKSAAPLPALSKSIAPAPAATKSATPASAASKTSSTKPVTSTTIEAKIDVGFGNQLFVRGEGEGLSWDRGIPLECVDSQTWRLVVPAKDKLQIKLLINDSVWAKGEDVVVTPGKRVELVPAF
jgi:hypothetical protein